MALSGLHDSLVVGFSYGDETFSVTLVSREEDGLRTEIDLLDVRMLHLDEVWEATTVFGVFIWNAHDLPEDYRFDPNAGWRHLLEGRGDERDKIDNSVERALRDLPSGFLFSLTSSYGGSISVLCAGRTSNSIPPRSLRRGGRLSIWASSSAHEAFERNVNWLVT